MKFIGKIKGGLNSAKDKRSTASVPQHNDCYVVEFPKSGVTWLSALLANMALIESGRKEYASFSSAHLYVPDVSADRCVGPVPYDRPPVRFIKSHATFNRKYIFVLYLVRHPFDVMKSYYRYSCGMYGDLFGDFSQFCENERLGIQAWKRHVNSWLSGPVISQRLHLIRYEDLIKDAAVELELMSRNFGWNISGDSIMKAVDLSSMTKMKESEELYRLRNPRYKLDFIGGKSEFSVGEKDLSYFQEVCGAELRLLGY